MNMIILSDALSDEVKGMLNVVNNSNNFLEKDLESITSLNLSANDIQYLNYFKNVVELELSTFPSIKKEDIFIIANKLPNLKSLKIKEQNAIFDLDVGCLTNLEELCLIHNDNLISIKGIDKLKRFTFYDNKDYRNIEQIVDLLVDNMESNVTLDIVYYVDALRELYKLNKDISLLYKFNWVESSGLRKFNIYEYSKEEIKSLVTMVSDIVSKYTYVTDGEVEKFGVLYRWMITHVKFVNEDDPKGENLSLISNIYKVFNFGMGGRLSYAKAFQFLLSFAGVKSTVVYSLGAYDTIGYYNGQKVYSLLGTSDYALLRVSLDNKYYYCDIAWDCMVNDYKYFDVLRLFLLSKDELKIRHKFVGESEIEHSYSYHGDDSDDLIMFANDRLKEVDDLFNDIERLNSYISGAELNCMLLKKELSEIKDSMSLYEEGSMEYKNYLKEIKEDEELFKCSEIDLIRYKNMRVGIINSYSGRLNAHYLGLDRNMKKDEVLALLKKKKEVYLLSDYMYKILYESIKTA